MFYALKISEHIRNFYVCKYVGVLVRIKELICKCYVF